MQYREFTYVTGSWDTFFYEKNLQGDVVAAYDANGTLLVTYSYDSYGVGGPYYRNGGAGTGISKNPFRYRGYYYDSDLNLYYLNSRYYDHTLGRFISPDSEAVITATPTALTDKNLYAYCDNNPLTRIDRGGEFWHIIVGFVAGGINGGAVSAASQLMTTGSVDWRQVGVSAGAGAASGALAVTGLGPAVQVAANTLISGTESALNQGIEKGFDKIDYGIVALDAVAGGVTSAGNGVGKGTGKHLMTQGIDATKHLRSKGLRKTVKHYASQTYTLFYKPLFNSLPIELISGTVVGVAEDYVKDNIIGGLYAR